MTGAGSAARAGRPTGYDFDTLAADLDTVLTELDLRDVTLVGFSLGTGELARYIGTYGTDRLRSCVFIESLAPSFVKSDANPDGVDQAGVDAVQQAILDDRSAWLTGLLGGLPQPRRLPRHAGQRGDRAQHLERGRRGVAGGRRGRACPAGWTTSSEDIKRIDVPTLILHGTADRILSIDGQGRRLHAALPDAHYVEIEGGPHVMCVTHAAEVNRELLAFLREPAPVQRRRAARRPQQGDQPWPSNPGSSSSRPLRAIVDATSTPPFLYELEPAAARKVLEDLQAAPVDKLPSRRSGSPCRPTSAMCGSASSARSTRPRCCRSSSTCTAAAGSSATPPRTTGSSASSPSERARRCCSSSTPTPPRRATRWRSSRDTPPPNGSSAKARRKGLDAAAWRSPANPWAATWPPRSRSWPSSAAT